MLIEQVGQYVAQINSQWDPRLTEAFIDLVREYDAHGGLSKHFTNELCNKTSFLERIWELLLFRMLKNSKYPFKIGKDGQPDFYIPKQQLWIEAIAPKPIDISDEYLNLTQQKQIISHQVPHDEIILRWMSAIAEKKRKLEQYKEKNVVKENEKYIIAISSCQLGDIPTLQGQSGYPCPVEIGYGIGPLVAYFYKDNPDLDHVNNTHRESVFNKNKSPVETQIFFNPENNCVSGILGSTAGIDDILNCNAKFALAHNYKATNPLPRGIFKSTDEYIAITLDESKLKIEKIN